MNHLNIDPMSEGLIRQRRNLISISCILIFLKFADVEITKLSFLGLDFSQFGNPSALYLAIWICFAYFSFRYYQYFSQEGRGRLSRYYYDELEIHVMKRVKKLADGVNKISNYYPHQLIGLQNENWNIRITYDGGDDGAGGRKTEVVNIVFPINELTRYRFLAITNMSFNTSAVSDYLLPFLLALGAITYCFHGSASSLCESIINGFA